MRAGVTCGGPTGHEQRLWYERPGRVLSWSDGSVNRVLAVPVPGAAPLLLFDAFNLFAFLDNGEVWRFDTRDMPQWRPSAPTVKESDVKATKNLPAVLACGSGCGAVWVVTSDRRLWSWTVNGAALVVEVPIPGEGKVLAVDLSRRAVVLEGGFRYDWLGGAWRAMPGLAAPTGTVRVRCLSGTTLASGDFNEGEERDVSEHEARELLRTQRAELVLP